MSATRRPLGQLIRLLEPDRSDLLAVLLFSGATGVFLLATPIAVQTLVNFVALGGALPPLFVVASLLFGGLLLAGALSAMQAWIVEVLQRRLFTRVIATLASRLPSISLATHESGYPPETVNRFFDVITIQKTLAGLLLNGLSIGLSVIVGLVVLAFYHPLLLAFDLVLILVIMAIVLAPLGRGVSTAMQESRAKYSAAAWLQELARNPYALRTAGAKDWIFERTDEVTHEYIRTRTGHFRVLLGQMLLALGLQAFASTALLSIGGYLVIKGALTLGQLVAAELIVTMIVSSTAKLGKQLESYYDLMAATDKLHQVLDLEIEPLWSATELEPSSKGVAVRANNLLVHCPSGEPRTLSFGLEPGESAVLRTSDEYLSRSFAETLFGLRKPERGALTYDGFDIDEISRHSVRRAVGLAIDVEIVTGSVLENVALGRNGVDAAHVRNRFEALGVLERLQLRHEGLKTLCTAHGRPLDEATLDAIQITRAMAGRPRLLVVSEKVLPDCGLERERVLDHLLEPGHAYTLVILSNADDVAKRTDRVLRFDNPITLGESA